MWWIVSLLTLMVPVNLSWVPTFFDRFDQVADSSVLYNDFVGIHDSGRGPVGGFGTYRLWDVGTQWCDVNPRPGVWDFQVLKSRVDVLPSSASVLVVLGVPPGHLFKKVDDDGAASWLCSASPGGANRLADLDDFEEYVRRISKWLAAQYPDRRFDYQVFNEPAVKWFLHEDESIARLVKYAVRAREVLDKTVGRKDYFLVSPSLIVNGRVKVRKFQKVFLDSVVEVTEDVGSSSDRVKKSDGLVLLFDVYALHAYPKGYDEVSLLYKGPDAFKSGLDDMLGQLNSRGLLNGSVDVWFTEVNANINFSVSESAQYCLTEDSAAFFVQEVLRISQEAGVGKVIFYTSDYTPGAPGHGDVRFSYRPLSKPLVAALSYPDKVVRSFKGFSTC